MYLPRIRLWVAAMVAFMLGFPMAEKARADCDWWCIVGASIDLIYAIVDVAGDS
jgi:hypothetical protein